MTKKQKKWLARGVVLLVIVIIAAISAYSFSQSVEALKSFSYVNESYEKLTTAFGKDTSLQFENANFTMTVGGSPIDVVVTDKKTGKVWSSGVSEEYYPEKTGNNYNVLLGITYRETKKNGSSNGYLINSQKSSCSTYYKKLDNGVTLDFSFDKQKIRVRMDITLTEDGISVVIPENGVLEEDGSKNMLLSADIFPTMEAARIDEDGYLFYPDGSGALYEFKGREDANTLFGLTRLPVYSPKDVDVAQLYEDENDGIHYATMPVFGVKRGDTAVVGYVADGDENSEIVLEPTTYRIPMFRVHSTLVYRAQYTRTQDKNLIIEVGQDFFNTRREVRYAFLQGEEADYSGMANAYRDYLLESGQLNPSVSGTDIPLSLDVLNGMIEEQVVGDVYHVMTSFEETGNMLDQFKAYGGSKAMLTLRGWTNTGYALNPSGYTVSNALGGKNGLKALTEKAKADGTPVYLTQNFVYADSNNGGFAPQTDIVRNVLNNVLVTNETEFLLSPKVALTHFRDSLAAIDGVSGFLFEQSGRLIFEDYGQTESIRRADTVATWQTMYKESRDKYGSCAVSVGNLYALPYADMVTNLASGDSEYIFTTNTVPFMQMVLHGSVAYTDLPGNLEPNLERAVLKWVEYGYMPYFMLTKESPSLLADTEFSLLFTSEADKWLERAAQIQQEMTAELGEVWSQKMVDHDRISETLVCVTYDSGAKVYVNYAEEAVTYDGVTVEALSYKLVKGGAN